MKKTFEQISLLKSEIKKLNYELMQYKSIVNSNNLMIGSEIVSNNNILPKSVINSSSNNNKIT